ncbi:MAG: PAS domain S-box protein, partial [Gemmatimonadota bacterium]
MTQIFPSVISPSISLSDALRAIDRAESSAARIHAAAGALHRWGFERVLISLRDASLNATHVVAEGDTEEHPGEASHSSYALEALPGAVWRRRLAVIERFREDELYLLDGSDPWVAREFFGTDPEPRRDGMTWLPTDLVVALLRGAEGELLGIVKMAGPRTGMRPSSRERRELASMMRHLGARLAYDTFRSLAKVRASRLQRLQEAGAAFARTLDEHEIVRELGRQAIRATNADGVAITAPDLDRDILTTSFAFSRGSERPRSPVRLGDGLIAEVARTGTAVRIGDREADRARERKGLLVPLSMYDIVGDSGSAASVLAVPMLVGIQLIGVLAVHAVSTETFSVEDEEVLATMASQAATAIANARRYDESERERRQTEALADVARAVSESLRLGEVLRLILRHAVALLGAEGACIALRNNEYVHIVAAVGAADVLAGVHLPVGNSLLGRSVTGNEVVVSNDFRNDPTSSRAVQHLTSIQRAVIAPLVSARGTIGAIAVINRDTPFTSADSRVLQRLSDHVAMAIVNARMFEEIERATKEWKVAFDSIPSGMVVLEEDLTIRRCNARAAELCGISIASLLGKQFCKALLGPSAERCGVETLVTRAIADGVSVRDTVHDYEKGRLYELFAAPHPDGGCVLTFDDVTSARRLAEQHRSVLETVSDAIVITGRDGNVTFANAAAHALFKRDTLLGERVSALTAPQSLAEVEQRERAAFGGAHQRYECAVQCADGEQRLVAITTAPQFELGQVTGTVACLRDITEQRADSSALARSEARYARLVESASDAIFTVDLDGRFTSVNKGVLDETGRTREELIGAPCAILIDPRDHGSIAALLERTVNGDRQRVELRYMGKGGAARVGLLTTDALYENDRVVGGLGIMRDTTDDTITREADAQQARLASVGALLGGVANEINNPLTALLAIAELEASSPTLAPADRAVLEQIRDEARRASSIVADLLESTYPRPLERVTVDLNRIVRGSMELQGYSLRQRGVRVVSALSPETLEVHADASQLQQALINLLVNAEEAVLATGRPGEIRIETSSDATHVHVMVTDTGGGIPEANARHVFEPMFTTRSERNSRGLGLTISRSIVRDHGGSVSFRVGDTGTTFMIAL